MLFNYVPNSHDEKIIYYVCGALIRSVVRTKKCDACKEALALDETPMQVQFGENLEAASFTAQINRGGLLAPHISKIIQYNVKKICERIFR